MKKHIAIPSKTFLLPGLRIYKFVLERKWQNNNYIQIILRFMSVEKNYKQ